MDRTKQLPPPTAAPLPFAARWHTPVLGGIAEVLTRLADVCLHPVIVLPLFFAIASDTATGIGRAIALLLGAGFLASAIVTPFSGERWPRLRLGLLVSTTALQAFILLGLGRAENWLATNRLVLTGSALLIFIIAALCGGAAETLRVAVVGIVRAEGSWRTRWGRWTVLGILGTIAGGLLARNSLTRTSESFPAGYTQLFTYAGLALLVAALCLGGLLVLDWRKRPAAPPTRPDLLAVPELLANNLAYGRYVFFRILYACGALADPFFIVYATRELGASGRVVAAYLVTLVVARAVGTLAWRAFSITGGNPLVLQLSAFIRLIAPITALTLPPLLGSATLRDRLPGGDTTNLIAFGIVFAAWGAANAGLSLAAPAIQSALTTPRERQAAEFVTGIALAVATLALPLGGLILDRLGFSVLFIAALVVGLCTLLAGGLIEEPGVFVLRPAPNERPVLRRRGVRREG
jgi:uncharacterized membrane protein